MSDWIEISIPYLKGNESIYLDECIKSNFVSSVGPFVPKFEKLIANEIGLNNNIKNTVATSSGTTALQIGLLAMGIKPEDIVIVPSYTFIATANSVSNVGASPWIVDIESNYLTIDPQKLQNELERNTFIENGITYHKETKQRVACIIPVYVFGCPPDIDAIKKVADKYSIPILLDSACGIGAKYKDKKLGQNNMPGIISFNGNKTITTGAGGIFFSNDEKLVTKVKHLSSTAKCSSKYDHDEIGFNFRMSNIQAALGLAQLEQLEKILKHKKIIHNNYKNELNSFNTFRIISNPPWGESSNWINAIIIQDEELNKIEKLIFKLRELKIRANYFWKPLHLQQPYKNSLQTELTHLDNIQEKVLVLPSSPNLSINSQLIVIDTIKAFFK